MYDGRGGVGDAVHRGEVVNHLGLGTHPVFSSFDFAELMFCMGADTYTSYAVMLYELCGPAYSLWLPTDATRIIRCSMRAQVDT